MAETGFTSASSSSKAPTEEAAVALAPRIDREIVSQLIQAWIGIASGGALSSIVLSRLRPPPAPQASPSPLPWGLRALSRPVILPKTISLREMRNFL
jgi:hypothetical protein